MLVKEIMPSPVVTVRTDTPAPEVARVMQERDIGAVVVVDEGGRLCGIITESDFTGIGRGSPLPPAAAARPSAWWRGTTCSSCSGGGCPDENPDRHPRQRTSRLGTRVAP